jgi:MFS family permease
MLLTGGVFSAMFGMAAVWGAQEGLGVREISIFVGALYVGGLVLQYPIGWVSDRMDRRTLIMGLSAVAALVMLVAALAPLPFTALIVVALLLGGITNPVYALLIAYTNDFLSREEMAAASAGLIFLNGFGAIFGPTATGWMMETVGPRGFFLFIAVLYIALTGYALYRMTRRAAPQVTGAFRGVTPTASPLAVGAVLDEAVKP